MKIKMLRQMNVLNGLEWTNHLTGETYEIKTSQAKKWIERDIATEVKTPKPRKTKKVTSTKAATPKESDTGTTD